MDKNKVEYRLQFREDNDNINSYMYFDTLNEVYNYITSYKLVTFMIVKEELIASRMDSNYASSEN